jgi:hypothetical protein
MTPSLIFTFVPQEKLLCRTILLRECAFLSEEEVVFQAGEAVTM